MSSKNGISGSAGASAGAGALPASNAMASGLRYPKRKRHQVSYREETNDDLMVDEEEISEPQSKRSKIKKSRPLPKHKIFPFMSLPAELRNKIYEMALLGPRPGPIFVTSKTKAHRRVAVRCTTKTCEPQFNRGRYGRRYRNWNRPVNPEDEDEEEEESDERTFAPNILAVSKTIHAESAFLLYSRPIVVADNNALLTFLSQIGPQHSAMLRDLTIRTWCDSRSAKAINFPAMSLLAAQATKLDRLNVACSMGWFGYWRGATVAVAIKVARQVYRDCYPWLEAIGRAKGDVFAGIDVLELSEKNFASAPVGEEGKEAHMAEQFRIYRAEIKRLLRA